MKASEKKKNEYKIKIVKNGPYIVSGKIPLVKEKIVPNREGDSLTWKKTEKYPLKTGYELCRCGNSCNKPYCDGSHHTSNFDGTETANRDKFLKQAEKIEGSNLILMDVENLCASARFCHRVGGVWNLTRQSGNATAKKIAIQEACNCPSGRLVVIDKKTGKEIEPKFAPSISLTEDPENDVSGPIWVKGKIPVEGADGCQYEVRNRVTLCRCGKSSNKPFCDGTHIDANFQDENPKKKK
jgi:CDGSH-type Zn-finger protein